MNRFFLYRINSDYDGFLPCHIQRRAHRRCMSYNWRAYLKNLVPGDIVLTYFTGRGCRKGIFAIARILRVKLGVQGGNVVGRLLSFSPENDKPLIDAKDNASLFENLHNRCRGAEIVIPGYLDEVLCRLLAKCGAIAVLSPPKDIPIAGTAENLCWLRNVPPLNRSHLSKRLRRQKILPAYWVRPSQATWITHAPGWLKRTTRVFRMFKAGDLSRLDILALALAKQIMTRIAKHGNIGILLSVPLCERKRRNGEVDRVHELSKRLSVILNMPYDRSLMLRGGVTRRFYRNNRLPDNNFRRHYQQNLMIRHTRHLVNCVKSGQEILLIDDVYTDGVTTETIVDSIRQEFGQQASVKVATLGIMAKARNMSEDLCKRWR